MAFGRQLTSLAEARAWLAAALPVRRSHQRVPLADSLGRIAAEEVTAERPAPATAEARYDGFAVCAADTAGAGLYSPLSLSVDRSGPARGVEVGDAIAAPLDAVVDAAAVTTASGTITLTEPAAEGAGVRRAGADIEVGAALLYRGQRVDSLAIARLAALGVAEVACRAIPDVVLLAAGRVDADVTGALLARALQAGGFAPETLAAGLNRGLEWIAGHRPPLAVIYGGSGWGEHDRVASRLAEHGEPAIRGIAMQPGQSAQLARLGETVVVVLPGSPWPALASYRLLARDALARWLTGRCVSRASTAWPLGRKLVSPLGLTELIPVARQGDGVVPLPRHAGLPPAGLVGAVEIEDGSEGHAAGETVAVEVIADGLGLP